MSSSNQSSSSESSPNLTPIKSETQLSSLPKESPFETQISHGTWSQATYPSQAPPKRKAESQFKPLVNKPPIPIHASSLSSSTLLTIPADLKETRQRVFALEAPIRWTKEEFNRLWPYMDTF